MPKRNANTTNEKNRGVDFIYLKKEIDVLKTKVNN
jgi:hypothetical protein